MSSDFDVARTSDGHELWVKGTSVRVGQIRQTGHPFGRDQFLFVPAVPMPEESFQARPTLDEAYADAYGYEQKRRAERLARLSRVVGEVPGAREDR